MSISRKNYKKIVLLESPLAHKEVKCTTYPKSFRHFFLTNYAKMEHIGQTQSSSTAPYKFPKTCNFIISFSLKDIDLHKLNICLPINTHTHTHIYIYEIYNNIRQAQDK